MNRQAHEKAAKIRQAISTMREELKTAAGKRLADLQEDIGLAMDDFMALTDLSLDDSLVGEPMIDEPVAEDPFSAPFEEEPELLPSPVDDLGDVDTYIESFDDFVEASGVPMGALDDNTNIYASTETHNREHVSYILERVAEVVQAIEAYEDRQAKAKKASKSSGARKAIAGTMKKLAQVVNSADFTKEATGDDLSKVGVEVQELHKKLVK